MSADYILRLYLVGDTTPRSQNLKVAVEKELDARLKGRYALEIVDVLRDVSFVRQEEVWATPTLVRVFPLPRTRILGRFREDEGALPEVALAVNDVLVD